jgi:hypothetical protein
MNIIFLDIDGVLVTHMSMLQYKNNYTFDDNCFRILRQLINDHSLNIVLSSTWRKYDFKMKYLDNQFLPFNIKILDKTPTNGKTRGQEIQSWLSTITDVDNFIILDDDSDMDHLCSKLVQTTMSFGLQEYHIYQIQEKLYQKNK